MQAVRVALVVLSTLSLTSTGSAFQRDPIQRNRPLPLALAQEIDHVPGELLVKFREDAPEQLQSATRQALGADVLQVFTINGVEHWRLPPGMSVERARAALARGSAARSIEYCEPNYFQFADQMPNDPLLSQLWGMHNIAQVGGTTDADIDAIEAWQMSTGSSAVVVGVIDSGIDYTHPDLAANIWTNPGEIAGNGIDDDGNGYVDDVRGWDFANGDNNPMDDNGHGSHTAGTVGAVGGNGVGVAGVAWNVRLMPLKFLNSSGSGSTSNAILAIQYAAGKSVPITNNSWGGGPKSTALQSAITNAGALFVASAGNSSTSTKAYPAGYDSANILSVAATTVSDGLSSYSNFSSTWVDVAAPGDNVLSCMPGGQYGTMSGTSMAAPHVSGTAALLLAQNPGWGAAQLKSQIMASVDPLAALAGKCITGGRINARRAVGAGELPADSIAPASVADLHDTATATHAVTLEFTAPADLVNSGQPGMVFSCEIRFVEGMSFSEADWDAAAGSVTLVPGAPGSAVTIEIPDLGAGITYAFALKSQDLSGNRSTLSNSVTATTQSGVPGWTVVSPDRNASPYYISHDFDLIGNAGIAYELGGNVVLARWNGAAWNSEIVMAGGAGTSFAFDPSGVPTLTHGSGKVYFCSRGATSWTNTIIESKNSGGDVTSLAYNPVTGAPSVCYRSGSGLRFAYRSGTNWIKETADASAGARYCALAFDAQGNPAIAYSDDFDGDGWLDSLWLARRQGSTWTSQMLDGPVQGYGVHAAIAFDATTQSFVISHASDPSPRLWRWSGSAWVVDSPPEAAQYIFGCGLVVSPDGTANLAYSIDSEMRTARRSPSGAWTVELIDAEYAMPFNMGARLTRDGRASFSYSGYGASLSTRDTP